MQLRPDGASGLLVSSVEAFKDYQNNKAWVWEHQAITRARFIAGDRAIGDTFESIRVQVLTQKRDSIAIKEEVIQMRQKMRTGHMTAKDMFDLKQGRGGIIDVEFMVQYLVLVHANQYPSLTENIGNIALLSRLSDLGLIAHVQADAIANAYRALRSMQHALRLQGQTKAQVPLDEVEALVKPVSALWGMLMA